ncbi:MAG TPA: nitroreductase family protein [Planctomycetota bacterium]|nr:nitroreductase family protein [Planctomycetota bacterium]
MDTAEAIRARRAVKHYDPHFVLPSSQLDELLDLAIQAPTSFNMQQWRFVLVQDKQLRSEIRAAANDQAQITDASLLFVLCADVKAWEKEPQRYWRNAPQPVQDILVPWMKPFYEGNERLQRDEAMRSVGIVAQTIMLAAKSMGYDSCPMIGFDAVKVGELIRLPQDHVVGMIVVVGKATQPAWPKPGQLPLSEVLVHDRF